jgi:hypothetical protein
VREEEETVTTGKRASRTAVRAGSVRLRANGLRRVDPVKISEECSRSKFDGSCREQTGKVGDWSGWTGCGGISRRGLCDLAGVLRARY